MLSGGYQIQIKATLDEETRTCIQDVLMKNHLTIKITEPDAFMIYRPSKSDKHNEK